MLKNVNIIIYQYKQEKFIDFSSLLYVCSPKDKESTMRSKVWRHVIRKKYNTVNYCNKILYPLNQILNDTELIEMMSRPEELLAALKED